MRLKEIIINDFKRFKRLHVSNLPESARLVVLVGPNGSGKSSLFDAFNVWFYSRSQRGLNPDRDYYARNSINPNTHYQPNDSVQLDFYGIDTNPKRSFSIRSAHRNEADFNVSQVPYVPSIDDRPVIARLIDNDQSVSSNYLLLLSETVSRLYSPEMRNRIVGELVDELTGEVRLSISKVFDDLTFLGIDQPFSSGSFRFQKGTIPNYHYKNLSAGEKTAFDLFLDMAAKRAAFENSIFCIDEPEAHLNSQVQALVLRELYRLTPDHSQLWIATHSIGMIREAFELYQESSGSVVFLNFFDRDFDNPVKMIPNSPDRAFWLEVFGSALGDLAQLVAPSTVFLCEGKVPSDLTEGETGFDALCYKRIFSERFPNIEFLSVGNSRETKTDSLNIGRSIQTLVTGVNVVRLIDQDDHSESEVLRLNSEGVRVLSRRHIESYLLDDEILTKLCINLNKHEKAELVIQAKTEELERLPLRNRPSDDVKAVSRSLYARLRTILDLRQTGSDTSVFLYEVMTPLITPGTRVYQQLFNDLFGSLKDDGKV